MLTDDQLTHSIIGCFRWVYNKTGSGLLESAYSGAMIHACSSRGLSVERQVCVPFYFDGVVVANYRLDLVVEGRVLVELKSCARLQPEHIKQVMHYLRTTDVEIGLLLGFGEKPEVKRFTIRNVF